MDSFDQIYEKYHIDIYRFLLNLSGYRQILSEELTQETFFQAYRSIHKFIGECHVKTWMIGIAKNVFRTYLRKEKKAIPIDNVQLRGNTQSNPFDFLVKREMMETDLQIIEKMQKNMADVMIFRIVGKVPYAQIVRKLGISESSAKVLYCRGKVILQKQLREVYGYEI